MSKARRKRAYRRRQQLRRERRMIEEVTRRMVGNDRVVERINDFDTYGSSSHTKKLVIVTG